MSQKGLASVVTLSIKNNSAQSLDFSEVVKARKVNLRKNAYFSMHCTFFIQSNKINFITPLLCRENDTKLL
jgi:hypothetical protein